MLLPSVAICASSAVKALACANHSLQSFFFQKEFFGELIFSRHLNMDFKNFLIVILSDLIKLSLSFKTKTSVRVKGEWHAVWLADDMIMRNVIYAE